MTLDESKEKRLKFFRDVKMFLITQDMWMYEGLSLEMLKELLSVYTEFGTIREIMLEGKYNFEELTTYFTTAKNRLHNKENELFLKMVANS